MKNENSIKNRWVQRKGLIFIVILSLSMGIMFIGNVQNVEAVTETFVEDFTTTTYMDAANTNATGWGTGEISCPEKQLELVGEFKDLGRTFDVAISGDNAFVSDSYGLRVIDISDYSNPTQIGFYEVQASGDSRSVAIAGDYVYVANEYSGLHVINISDPTNPTEIGHYETPGVSYDVAISGDCAFVADYSGGLRVIDISDPTNPTEIGHYDTFLLPIGIAISGNYAYIACCRDGLQVVDISNPENLGVIGYYDTPGFSYDVALAGDYAFVADGSNGLLVFYIKSPWDPILIGFYDTPGDSRGIAISGNHAFVADGISGLRVIDINNPFHPFEKRFYDTQGWAWSVTLSGNYAFVADFDNGLCIIKIADYTNLERKWQYKSSFTNVYDIAIFGDLAFILDGNFLWVYQIYNPTKPIKLSRRSFVRNLRAIAISGNYAFIAAGNAYYTIDIRDPIRPSLICERVGEAYDVAVSGDYLFIAGNNNGLYVYDISNPINPIFVARCDTPGKCIDVVIQGDLAFVADYYHGLQIIDISDPTNPYITGSFEIPRYACSVTIFGDLAYIASGREGLFIVDVSDPLNPIQKGFLGTDAAFREVTIIGDMAYITNYENGVKLLDISNPEHPVEIANGDTAGLARKLTIDGDYAFVSDDSGGICIIEIMKNYALLYEFPIVAQSAVIFSSGNSNIISSAKMSCYVDFVSHLSIYFYLSVDGGANWEQVRRDTLHHFTHIGNELKWRIVMTSTYPISTPYVYEISIEYTVEESEPGIDHPLDIIYEEGSAGNTITWNPWSVSPESFTVVRDAVIAVDYGRWDGGSITVNVDGLTLGEHLYVCSVYDTDGHCTTDTLFVTVIDITAPVIDHPADISYEEFTTGHVISWHPVDNNPASYNITRDGELLEEGTWLGADIDVNIDGLSEGEYSYQCFVYDSSGNSVSDIVQVIVTEGQIPLQPHGPILVEKDEDFVVKYNFPGSGTVEDPYRIENYLIEDYPTEFAICVQHTTKHFIVENCFIDNCSRGIDVYNTSSNTVTINNNIVNNIIERGIALDNSNGTIISNNQLYNGFVGIRLWQVYDGVVINNTCIDQFVGTYAHSSPNLTVSKNYCENSGFWGFCIMIQPGTSITDNICIKAGFNIFNYEQEFFEDITIENNLVNGKPYGFFYNEVNLVIDESIYGQLQLIFCQNVLIQNQVIQDTDMAIQLICCDVITLENNSLTNNGWGIYYTGTQELTIHNNTLSYNDYNGITAGGNSYDLKITNNTITHNKMNGISLSSYTSFEVTNNLIAYNELYGIDAPGWILWGIIHHNTFIDNNLGGTAQANDVDGGTVWYDVDTLEGNYWSDWSGTGPYYLEGTAGNADPYPLSEPLHGGSDLVIEPEIPSMQSTLPIVLTIISFVSLCVIVQNKLRRRKK